MERNGYQSLKNTLLRRGGTLVIKELDRLSRNKADIKAELESLKSMGYQSGFLTSLLHWWNFQKNSHGFWIW